MLPKMIGEIKVSRDRFSCVVVVFLHATRVFSESVVWSSVNLLGATMARLNNRSRIATFAEEIAHFL